jgi:hypothetical protein
MEFERHYYLLDTDMPDETRERYKSILGGHADRDVFKNSIQFLSKCLERYYGKKVILLIDEYDVPLENAFLCGFYDEMIDFIRALFESALKTIPVWISRLSQGASGSVKRVFSPE